MQLYSVFLKPVRSDFISTITESESAIVSQHFEWFKKLMFEKKLLFAGRTNSGSFGIALFQIETIEELNEIMNADPCIANGIFSFEIDKFGIALLDSEAIIQYATT